MSTRLLVASVLLSLTVAVACGQPPSTPATSPPTPAPAAAATPEPAPTPVDPAELRARANTAYGNKAFAECEQLYGQLVAQAPSRAAATDRYNAACCAALAGDVDRAFTHLDGAVSHGFRNAGHMEGDTDLVSLHDDPRWATLVERSGENLRAYEASINGELARIYREDQADREGPYESIDWSVVAPRDEQRRARVLEILAEGGAKHSDDYLHAAMVFQHGGEAEDYQRAHELAVKAVELDPGNDTAKWLAAAAKDRHLMHQGKPQLYGTQFRKIDGRWQLYEVDPTVTDEERARWNVPPLAQARKRAEMMNQRLPN